MFISPIKFQKKFDSRTISRELPYQKNKNTVMDIQNDHSLEYNVVEQSKTHICTKEKEAKKAKKSLTSTLRKVK